jgi:very-short-patch-repair endonuclease
MTKVDALLEDARKRLVETGTRNRLIHVNRKSSRGNLLNVVNERSDDIFQILRLNSKKMRFAGKGEEEWSDELTLAEISDQDVSDGRYTDSIIETPLSPDALQKRLLKLSRDARAAEEEQGINILFLAIGFLRWFEDSKSDVLRESPLILMPVELVRNIKTSTYDIVCRDDDIVTNLSLQERFKLDFGISLPEIDDSADWVPSDYFAEVEETIAGKERWSVDHDGMQLGFFSFAKLMMLRDLDPDNWDEESLLVNKLVTGLLSDGFELEPPLFAKDDNLDEKIAPERILHVVDADSSQSKVIEEVRSGRNLVVQGPPGTGKSQTITNILAAAAHDNKKVLFVAEKMAALEVVYNRMGKVGLKDLCVELHSRSANKKVFLQGLAETISKSKGVEPPCIGAKDLKEARDELNRLTSLLHSKLPQRDYSPFDVLAKLVSFISAGAPAPRFEGLALEAITKDEEARMVERLGGYLATVEEYGSGTDNPFFGSTNLDLQPTDVRRLIDDLQVAQDCLNEWSSYQEELEANLLQDPRLTLSSADSCRSVYVQLQKAPHYAEQHISVVHNNLSDARFYEAVSIGASWVEHKRGLSGTVNEVIWDHDLDHLRQPIAKGLTSFLSRIFGGYRSASKELSSYLKAEIPSKPEDRLKLLDSVLEGRRKAKAFADEESYMKTRMGESWLGERTPFNEIETLRHWLQSSTDEVYQFSAERLGELFDKGTAKTFDAQEFDRRKDDLIGALAKVQDRLVVTDFESDNLKSLSLAELKNRIYRMIEHSDAYSLWTRIQFAKNSVLEFSGLADLLARVEDGTLELQRAPIELSYAVAEARWNYAREIKPELNSFARLDRHTLVSTFQKLERDRLTEVQAALRDAHLSRIPKGSAGEMGIIRGEIAKKRKHLPIRRLMTVASEMIQRIKPIFFMSPISVAQFLPPGKVEFDLLVIDEASQVKPEDALGSIARAKQIVVVGDQKQLPPTSFFDRLTDNAPSDEDEEEEFSGAKATEMESVLSLCEARGLTESMLEWHYRSRDPSLIALSNAEFYRNRLILPPCPTESDENFGLKLVRVPGVYSTTKRGGGRPTTNRIEAEAIADRLHELALTRPDFSLGVVTFSKAQADMVTEVLEFRRREDDVLDRCLREDKIENVFVKNIENVQGDERDVILISVGYGPHEPNGRLASMSFGPVNAEGGERRLNVLFSRSRIVCEVFTSFDPAEIDLSRTSKEGPVVLKRFLEYAKTGELTEEYVSEGEADSPLEEDVAEAIRKLGYEVDHQVGTAGFKIDLGVKDPANAHHHILAVECDGATYHSALWARERDRMRQQVLEGFGWQFHRIWSTDWFYQREKEMQRLREALERARVRDIAKGLKGSNSESPSAENDIAEARSEEPIVLEDAAIEVPKYEKARVVVGSNYEPHERPLQQVVAMLCQVVAVEGPVHIDEIARRYAAAHGKSRVGSRIGDWVKGALSRAKRDRKLDSAGKFWATEEQFAAVPVRDRSAESIPTTSADSISTMEILACAKLIESESGAVEEEEMVRAVAKTMGFKRAGPEFQALVKKSLKQLKR